MDFTFSASATRMERIVKRMMQKPRRIICELQNLNMFLLFLATAPDAQRFFWYGMAAERGEWLYFMLFFSEQVRKLNSSSCCASVVFMIGKFLKRHLDVEKREIFGKVASFDDIYIGPARQAVSFFDAQCLAHEQVHSHIL